MSYRPQLLSVSEGGTGVATLTGIPLGSGTSAFSTLTFTDATSFTPHILFNGSEIGQAFNYNVGYYSQVGNIVFIQSVTSFSSIGISSGPATYTLPVAASSTSNFYQTIPGSFKSVSFGSDTFNLYLETNPGATTTAKIFGNAGSSGTVTQFASTDLGGGSLIQISGIYFV
jgi:hypothetical protein